MRGLFCFFYPGLRFVGLLPCLARIAPIVARPTTRADRAGREVGGAKRATAGALVPGQVRGALVGKARALVPRTPSGGEAMARGGRVELAQRAGVRRKAEVQSLGGDEGTAQPVPVARDHMVGPRARVQWMKGGARLPVRASGGVSDGAAQPGWPRIG